MTLVGSSALHPSQRGTPAWVTRAQCQQYVVPAMGWRPHDEQAASAGPTRAAHVRQWYEPGGAADGGALGGGADQLDDEGLSVAGIPHVGHAPRVPT